MLRVATAARELQRLQPRLGAVLDQRPAVPRSRLFPEDLLA
jgi:hypothetical protein